MTRRLIALGLLLPLAALGGAWWWSRGSLPPLDGEQPFLGLYAPVEVLYDAYGVPHAYAAGVEDAWFTAGVLHARDRLWQMDLYRRAAYGRLSEVLGPTTLPIDRRLLTLGLREAAEAEWRAASPAVRSALQRYAAGVNAQLNVATGRRRPLEFQLVRGTLLPWTPEDSLVVGRLLAWRLAENHQSELVRAALAARFGATEAMRLGGRYPPDAPTVMQGPGGARLAQTLPSMVGPAPPPEMGQSGSSPTTRWPTGLDWLHPDARRGNSNNWVLVGRRTATGRPLLANDPHLQVEFPAVWYELHLVAAGLDVSGVTIPGTPFVILGHNVRVAWGMTNSGADVQDLYLERLDLGRRRVLYRGEWEPVQVKKVEIPVRGGASQPFEVWRTRHGPLFADVGLSWEAAPDFLSDPTARTGQRSVYALRWESIGRETAGAFEAINRASNWSDFTGAVERFAAPSQNFVYADVDGNIGYALSGSLPQRAGGGVGTMPVDGASGEGEWAGSLDPSSLPRVLNPASGYVTSSNNQVDRQWSGLITRDWVAPFRTSRLHTLIEAAQGVDLATASAWQNDVAGLGPSEILAVTEQPLSAAKASGDRQVEGVLAQLMAWDRQVDGRPVVTLYHWFEDALWRRTFFDEMGSPLFDRFYQWAGAERPAGLLAILQDAESPWFDDIGTIERRESRDDIVRLAAADTAARIASSPPPPWSEVHAVSFRHPLGEAGAPLTWLFNRGPSPTAGGTTTVMRVSHHRLRPFAAWEIPSWRQVFDVGAWDEALVVLPTGQSGHPLSPHYFDQHELWRTGQYRRQPFSRAVVVAASRHRALFVP
ncbi:MAG: penicillin acylase family protein [Acidobacteriota bacterium]